MLNDKGWSSVWKMGETTGQLHQGSIHFLLILLNIFSCNLKYISCMTTDILHTHPDWCYLSMCNNFYTPVWKTGRIMPWQCPSVRPSVRPSVCPSVRPSVRVFRTFLQHALRYQFETWYIHSVGGTTCRVWVASQLGHFDLVYSQK